MNPDENALFRTLIDNLPDLAWTALPDGRIDFFNRRWFEYTGTTLEQMQGWGWEKVHDPAVLPKVLERWKRSLSSGTPFEMEFPLRGADGVFRWFLTRVRPLRGPDGGIVRWFGSNTDIDEVVKLRDEVTAASRLKDASERARSAQWSTIQTLLESAPAPIALLRGPDLVLEFLNPRGYEIWNRSPEAGILGKPIVEAFPELRGQGFDVLLRQVVQTGESFQGNEVPVTMHRFGRDEVRFLNFVYSPMRNGEGAIDGVSVFAFDVTELVRSSRALAAMNDLALALSEARSVENVSTIIVDQGMGIVPADTCALYLLSQSGDALELVGHRGVAPEIVAQTRRFTESSGASVFTSLRSGESIWAETAEDYARIFPKLAGAKAEGKRARAFWSMPLRAEGRDVGLLGMGFYEEQRFSADVRALIETLTKQCAQALLRAARLEREERGRAWLATTLRSIGDAVIATDTDGLVTLMNGIAERLTGWTERDAIGRPLDEVFVIFSEQTREPCESPVAKVLREGAVVGLANHTVLRTKEGKEIPIDDSAAPIRDVNGALFGVVLVFRDVTGEKREHVRRDFLARAGAALASSLDYRSTLATVAQLAVPQLADWCAIDLREPGGRATQQVAVAHVDPGKIELARILRERYPPDPEAPTGVPEVIRSGKSELYAEIPSSLLEAAAQDGEHLRLIREMNLESALVVPLQTREGILGAVTFIYADSGRRYTREDLAFAEDFARRAALAIENARALKQAEDARAEERVLRREADIANRAKDEFLATVSHELRTPLNAILGWTLTARGRNPPEDLDRALAIIERNARRQARLIEDVLDVSRIISGKLSLTLGPTRIAEVIEGAIDAVTPAAEAKGIAVDVEAERALTITADGDRLQQVVWNLLANAVKFSPRGGRIDVHAYRQGSDVCIHVSDTGEGIPAEVLPHVFEPFRQADASTTRKHGGLGLGLAIVKQLVTAHGGTVQANSDGPGHGSKFVVILPARSAVSAVSGAPSPPARTSTISDVNAPPRLDGLTVLVVDDEEDARLIVDQVLRDHGATVVAVASGAEALEAVARETPDVIVSDIGMPEMDGYMLLRSVRRLPAARGGRTPAVALTAFARKEDAQRAFAAGFQMHVPKPVEPAHLATVVGNLGGRTVE